MESNVRIVLMTEAQLDAAAAVLKQLGECCLSAADTLAARPETVDEGWLKRTVWEVWRRQETACDELVALLSKKVKGRRDDI